MLEEVVTDSIWRIHPGLPGRDYHAQDVWELEQERIFGRSWYCVGREQQVAGAGDYFTHEIAGESVIVIRGKDGAIRAFANVCRHRGSRLLNDSGCVNAIKCPYHAWTYGLDGQLNATPNVLKEDGLPREEYGLYAIALETWQGFIFISLAAEPEPLLDKLAMEGDGPLDYDRYRLDELRVAHTIVYEVEANWKIVIDNYNECLHCPSVHPELVKLVPIFRKGMVFDPARNDPGVTLDDGMYSFTMSGTSELPQLPGLSELDCRTYYGYAIFPNLLVNLLSTGVMVYYLYPTSASHTRIVSEYLYRPETIEREDFDPSDMVEFLDLVSRQDWEVCENAQRGVTSRFFERGVYPPQDALLHRFAERYLAERDRP
jgi:phenylpropionate dioxygenase-like ring-hydroxylating dioxygenase large terminal subunit